MSYDKNKIGGLILGVALILSAALGVIPSNKATAAILVQKGLESIQLKPNSTNSSGKVMIQSSAVKEQGGVNDSAVKGIAKGNGFTKNIESTDKKSTSQNKTPFTPIPLKIVPTPKADEVSPRHFRIQFDCIKVLHDHDPYSEAEWKMEFVANAQRQILDTPSHPMDHVNDGDTVCIHNLYADVTVDPTDAFAGVRIDVMGFDSDGEDDVDKLPDVTALAGLATATGHPVYAAGILAMKEIIGDLMKLDENDPIGYVGITYGPDQNFGVGYHPFKELKSDLVDRYPDYSKCVDPYTYPPVCGDGGYAWKTEEDYDIAFNIIDMDHPCSYAENWDPAQMKCIPEG